MTDEDRDLPEISRDELQRRVAYSLLELPARLVRRTSIPLKELKALLEMACFHELKRLSMTLRESAEQLGVSRRKAAELSSRLKENFFEPERAHELPRRIEYMLWAGPMTEGRIQQSLSEYESDEVTAALDQLVDEERAVVDDEGYTTEYAVPDSEFRLYENDWLARIDGLNNLLSNLFDAVVGRFFEENDSAFARTVDFRMREEDLEELRDLYENEIYQRLAELEARVEDADEDEVVEMSLSTLWAPEGLGDPDSK